MPAELTTAARARQAAGLLRALPQGRIAGRVASAGALSVEITGLQPFLSVGARVNVESANGPVPAEVVALSGGQARAMAYGALEGVRLGAPVVFQGPPQLHPDDSWLGRVVDPLGRPMDGRGPVGRAAIGRPLRGGPPEAGLRARLGPRLDLGVRAMDAFCTMRTGQRLGLFAASGVGKSTLLSMLARGADCDAAVLCLVGERGRELREFIEDDLGPEGLARSVVVCATSDSPPLMRREAAYAAMTVAESLAANGRHVLLMMDSVTRFALACREIGLAAGEPPATRGYTPGVFAELPRLLERAGPGLEGQGGAITGLFTVLVEGDDHDEPIADAVRGILDGHVVLDRKIGERGRWPAIDILRSLSRTVPGCLTPPERETMQRARRLLSLQADMAELVRLGAYRAGTDPAVDEALQIAPRIEAFLSQRKDEPVMTAGEAFAVLAQSMEAGAGRA
ncbi:flagellum-specific ATP synthase FliI [Pseudoroseomonas deserti]|uniref:Flagellum-specific ATP synthase FliI n=1 Tax=Teichococcus deserti TaxID=1817963 RepID=A0A1V2H3Q4_9PROT|nr:FliI/YscN family ATPase [Pseudoroseomonas deserti]ONG54454.1 flagellum-specific ATP synthase FliI [Pseudoroseomonas deserti]